MTATILWKIERGRPKSPWLLPYGLTKASQLFFALVPAGEIYFVVFVPQLCRASQREQHISQLKRGVPSVRRTYALKPDQPVLNIDAIGPSECTGILRWCENKRWRCRRGCAGLAVSCGWEADATPDSRAPLLAVEPHPFPNILRGRLLYTGCIYKVH